MVVRIGNTDGRGELVPGSEGKGDGDGVPRTGEGACPLQIPSDWEPVNAKLSEEVLKRVHVDPVPVVILIPQELLACELIVTLPF